MLFRSGARTSIMWLREREEGAPKFNKVIASRPAEACCMKKWVFDGGGISYKLIDGPHERRDRPVVRTRSGGVYTTGAVYFPQLTTKGKEKKRKTSSVPHRKKELPPPKGKARIKCRAQGRTRKRNEVHVHAGLEPNAWNNHLYTVLHTLHTLFSLALFPCPRLFRPHFFTFSLLDPSRVNHAVESRAKNAVRRWLAIDLKPGAFHSPETNPWNVHVIAIP